LTEEELDNCLTAIDADGNGTITVEEFAEWYLCGKEIKPSLLSGTEKYNRFMMSKLNTDEKIRNKDIRNLSLEFNVKDFDAKNDSGIKLNAKFAIANINNDPINA